MIQSLHFRQANPLGGKEWRSGQFGVSPFPHLQSLYDLGFDVGALAADLDLFLSGETIPSSKLTNATLLGTAKRLDSELKDFYERFSQASPTPIFWNAPHYHPNKSCGGRSSPEVPLAFQSLSIADLVTNFWTVRLLLSIAILKLNSMDFQAQSSARDLSPVLIRDLAVLITRSTDYCLSDKAGQYGPLRFLFPLRVALVTFQNITAKMRVQFGPDHFNSAAAERYRAWCQDCYRILVDERQVKYARDLENYPSRWQSPRD